MMVMMVCPNCGDQSMVALKWVKKGQIPHETRYCQSCGNRRKFDEEYQDIVKELFQQKK